MNKKAFVLMETIVVIVVISVALLTIFASYNKILTKVKTENKYDTSEYIYMTKYIKDYLSENQTTLQIFSMNTESGTPENYYKSGYKYYEDNVYKIKGIYLLKYINDTKDDNLKKFDAYMIDYIRKLDVGDDDTIIIVEYERISLDDKGEPIRPTKCIEKESIDGKEVCKPLTETYIASLEWDK